MIGHGICYAMAFFLTTPYGLLSRAPQAHQEIPDKRIVDQLPKD
jgi:hypothetical protein